MVEEKTGGGGDWEKCFGIRRKRWIKAYLVASYFEYFFECKE